MKKYHWIPDLPDHRDHVYQYMATPVIPKKVDLRNVCSTVEDQGQLGSCTGNAIVGAMEVLENKTLPPDQFKDLSRLFVYYNERAIEGTVSQDAGGYIRDGIKSLVNLGVCTESLWPYKVTKFATKPTKASFTDALKRKITSYSRIEALEDMKNCLALGYPFVFGFTVYESFESPEVAATGVVNLPSRSEKCLGGHAVLCVGYDDDTQRFLVRNSWGAGWGQKGYFTMPYRYLTNRNLSDDFWTVRK